jgi:hypothetical protein
MTSNGLRDPRAEGYTCPEAYAYMRERQVYCNIRGLAYGSTGQPCDCREYEDCPIYIRMDMFLHLSKEEQLAFVEEGKFGERQISTKRHKRDI